SLRQRCRRETSSATSKPLTLARDGTQTSTLQSTISSVDPCFAPSGFDFALLRSEDASRYSSPDVPRPIQARRRSCRVPEEATLHSVSREDSASAAPPYSSRLLRTWSRP